MKKLLSLVAVALLCAGLSPTLLTAQQKTEPQFKLIQFQLVILKQGPQWGKLTDAEVGKFTQEHVKYIRSLIAADKMIVAGHFTDNADVRGVCIFRVVTPAEAKTLADNDPPVKAGLFDAEIHPWWAEDILKKPGSTLKLEQLYFCFLARGPKWTAEKTAATESLQTAHLANIVRLAKMNKLLIAGPFGDGGSLAGIFVFRVASEQEAQTLMATDPAVQAGRLVAELHPWMVPEGIFPGPSVEMPK
jgi:uncharacterized protein YciI